MEVRYAVYNTVDKHFAFTNTFTDRKVAEDEAAEAGANYIVVEIYGGEKHAKKDPG